MKKKSLISFDPENLEKLDDLEGFGSNRSQKLNKILTEFFSPGVDKLEELEKDMKDMKNAVLMISNYIQKDKIVELEDMTKPKEKKWWEVWK